MDRHASLNRIFRLVWSQVHQAWVVVSETSRGRGKRTSRRLLLAAVACAAAQVAQAGPAGGQVTSGSGAIQQSGTTTTVTQSSPQLSLSWQGFNTSAGETVKFVQPSSGAIAVNRILDTNATRFLGQLQANGQVYLINPNGILFGAGSQVNVGGLVASTLDVADSDLASATRRFSGTGTGSIVNQGSITAAPGGSVAFIGNKVVNQGQISAPRGAVALGAGSDVTLSFAGNSLLNLQVNQGTLDNLAENGGLIQAQGGAVVLSAGARDSVLASVVNNAGVIEARSVQDVNGTIVLGGGAASTVTNAGTLDASGQRAGEQGGTVKVLGDQVQLASGSRIDVSGDTGGGLALVGGNFLGSGPERNAQATTVAAAATVKADALRAGDGGQVAVWSDGTTRFHGAISARGGQDSGNGGHIETSGAVLKVGRDASIDTRAPHGAAGDWLLDPQDLTIGGFNPGDGDIDGADITAALQYANVTIKTSAGSPTCTNTPGCGGHSGSGDIILADGALVGGFNWTSSTTLTLSAYRNVELRGTANLDSSNGTGSMVLRADNAATGVGTVLLSGSSNVFGNPAGTVKIYYNPTSYGSPTNYASMMDQWGGPTFVNANMTSYMLVNVVASVANKTYDGTTAATMSGLSILGAAPWDATVNLTGATVAFTDKDAGIGKATLISGVTLAGSGAYKYELNGLDTKTATISRANLALSGITANNKTYDSTTSVTLSGTASVTPIGSDVVGIFGTGAGSHFADKGAGTGKAVVVAGYSMTGPGANNYILVLPTNLTADIHKASLNVSGVSANGKTYDGTAAATLSGSASVSALGSDVVSVTGTGTGTFADKNAGSNKAVTVTGYSLGGADAGNYAIVQPTGLAATIAKASVAVGGVTANDKTYDGTAAATLSGTATVAAIGSDVVSVTGTGTGTFADKNAGTGKAVAVSGYTLTGADAGNYTVVQPSGLTATIAKAALAVSGVAATDKTYDGTTAATLSGTASVSALAADVVSVGGTGIGTFADKDAGSGKAVAVTGYTLTGADAGNYAIVQPAGLTATIGKATLVVSGVTASDKIYDGTTAATLAGSAAVTAIGSDVVAVTGNGTGTFADKNAGANKAVAVTGYTLTGTDAGNYDVVQPSGLVATIAKASLVVGGVTANDKTYDGTTGASLSGTASVAAFGSDMVSVAGSGSAWFADKNAGVGKAVAVGGYTLTGADAGNYDVVQPSGLTASIGKATLVVSGLAAAGKTYDGTTAATLSGTAAVSALGADVVSLTGTGTGTFADKNAGTGKAVGVGGYTLTGADAGNYVLGQPTGLRADIAPATLTVSGITAADKPHDGTVAATVSTAGAVLAGKLASDNVTVASTGSFRDAAVGIGKPVDLANTYGGADAGNYRIVDQRSTVASIRPAPATALELGNTVAQVQSSVLAPQAGPLAQAMQLPPVLATAAGGDAPAQGSLNGGAAVVVLGSAPGAPRLRVQDGGLHLPPQAVGTSE